MSPAAGSSGRRSVISRRLIVAVALVGVAAIVAIIAVSATPKTLTHADLVGDPAFALKPAGADQLLEVGSEAQQGVDGSAPAFAGHIFGTRSTSAEVYAFYERELGNLGWRAEPPPFARTTVEIENRLYCRAGRIFRLAIEDKNRAFQPSFYKGVDYVTVFDARLVSDDPHATCPRQG